MKNSMLIASCLSALAIPLMASGHATVTRQAQVMTTYPYSDPNPVAKPESNIYPYFLFEGYSSKPEQKEWQTVVLENDYLRLTIFPEVGGKLWGAYDKVNQREFIYTNNVVKFRNIAMRGPWTSGGIEFNFGIIGHEPTTSSPVDCQTRENPDGSVSCFVGSFDWMTRNYWTVEVRLPSDKAFFTTSATVYNASSIDEPYYQWMNAAFPAQNNPEFTYPGNAYIGHGGDAHPFPYDETGHPISWYDRNNFGSSKSYHVIGNLSDHFGIFWHGIDYGSIHYSNYDDKLGQKIFLWSLARDGAIWEDLLSDRHQQYIEMQSGRMYNQPQVESGKTPFKNNAIQAQTTDRWTEYWFPVAGTQGIVAVSPMGGLNVKREGEDVVLRFSPLAKVHTKLSIYNGSTLVKTLPLDAETLQTWTKTVSGLQIPEGKMRIVVGDHQLEWSEATEDNQLNRPTTLPKDFDWESTYGLYIRGEQAMNSLQYPAAEKLLKQAVEKDRYYAPALIRLASLYLHQAKYEQSLELLRTVLSLDAYSEEGNYLYGLCNLALGKKTDAKDGFSLATRSNAFRTAAYEQLGEIYFCEGNLSKARHYAQSSLQYNSRNLNALQLLSVIARTSGNKEEAKIFADSMLHVAPLYPASRFEAVQTGLATLEDFAAAETCEMPQETYQELALWYEAIGRDEEAMTLYDLVPQCVMAQIHKSYLLHNQGKEAEAKETLSKAMAISPDFVFPFRVEDKPALEYAVAADSCWKGTYYLAELLLSFDSHQEALGKLQQREGAEYAPYWQLLANETSGEEQLAALKKAEALAPTWRIGRDLMKYYQAQGDYQNVIKTGESYHRRYPNSYIISLALAKGYQEAGRNKECLKLLRSTEVLPYEGSHEGYNVYRKANLQEAAKLAREGKTIKAMEYMNAAKEYPENLGVGKPFNAQLSLDGISDADREILKELQ